MLSPAYIHTIENTDNEMQTKQQFKELDRKRKEIESRQKVMKMEEDQKLLQDGLSRLQNRLNRIEVKQNEPQPLDELTNKESQGSPQVLEAEDSHIENLDYSPSNHGKIQVEMSPDICSSVVFSGNEDSGVM